MQEFPPGDVRLVAVAEAEAQQVGVRCTVPADSMRPATLDYITADPVEHP